MHTTLSIVGFTSVVIGIGLNWGVGYALVIGGAVLFLAGGVASTRDPRAR